MPHCPSTLPGVKTLEGPRPALPGEGRRAQRPEGRRAGREAKASTDGGPGPAGSQLALGLFTEDLGLSKMGAQFCICVHMGAPCGVCAQCVCLCEHVLMVCLHMSAYECACVSMCALICVCLQCVCRCVCLWPCDMYVCVLLVCVFMYMHTHCVFVWECTCVCVCLWCVCRYVYV